MLLNTKGLSLVEALVGVAIAAISALTLTYVAQIAIRQQESEKMLSGLSQLRLALQNTLTNDSAWMATVTQSHNRDSGLTCLTSLTGCSAVSGPSSFSLFDAQGNAVYLSSSGSGFNLDGTQCTGAGGACPILFSLTWQPTCGTAAVDPYCNRPLIRVSGTFSAASAYQLPVSINFSKFNFTLERQALSWSPCTGSLPSCPIGYLIVCESTGWKCVAPNPVYCVGNTFWTVSGNTCGATIAAPGVLHNQLSALVSNTLVASFTGTAIFLCQPGQPNNGFILQPGAICAHSPTPGVCGIANGKTYLNSAAVPTPLCGAGATATPASLTDPGPWNWTCPGNYGGSTTACGAKVGNCPIGEILTWAVGTYTCSGPTPDVAPTADVNIPSTDGTPGVANFACAANGSWNLTPDASPAPSCGTPIKKGPKLCNGIPRPFCSGRTPTQCCEFSDHAYWYCAPHCY